ncbi:hypothetical protein [Aquabacterium humicola]|uniref:hypothetical protein n=1 Tax=Aquabacterium humicola TaxID=3237377 RepID=UPI002543CB49|nr:hypothetical protein [Rubrivivax pictus]
MPTIYVKTADGQNEIETRARRLSPRLRSALILVDGKRSDTELSKLIQQHDETLQALLDAGLIQAVAAAPSRTATAEAAPSPAPAPAPAPTKPAAAPAQADLSTRRREAVRAVNDLLGPAAETLALKIERATNDEQFREALERAVTYIANARGGGPAAQFAARFLPPAA